MVCCWISIITTSGIPIAQFASDGLPVPFSVQGVLVALQSNAAIRRIETELADIAYQLTSCSEIVTSLFAPCRSLTASRY